MSEENLIRPPNADPGNIIWRDFATDMKPVLEKQGLFLIDGKWKFFRPQRLKDLQWCDIREFLIKNYSPKALEDMKIYLDARRKQTRMDRDANTLYRGDDCILGRAEIPLKLLRALQMDYELDFGVQGDMAEATTMLKILEGHSVLSCFVIVPCKSLKV